MLHFILQRSRRLLVLGLPITVLMAAACRPGPVEGRGPTSVPVMATAPEALSPQARALAVRIEVDGCGFSAQGSGFFVSPHEVITNRHVVDGYRGVRVVMPDGTTISAKEV